MNRRLLAHIPADRPPSVWLRVILVPAALSYRAALKIRELLYAVGICRRVRVPRPVISVGNLRVGGGGKTPFTRMLVSRLEQRGLRVAVVSRGYGRTSSRRPVVVSRGAGPLVEVRRSGDEPRLLAERTGAIVVVASDRAAGARAAIDLGADVIVLDDGFQHWRLHRDLDLVLLDARAPLGSGGLLPLGSLREGPCALARAHLLVLNHGAGGCRPGGAPGGAKDLVCGGLVPGLAGSNVLHVVAVPRGLWALASAREETRDPCTLSGVAVALYSAIARPRSFRETVEALGAVVVYERHEHDHAWPRRHDIEAFAREAKLAGAMTLLTTEKDAMRFDLRCIPEARFLWVVGLEHEIVEGGARLESLLDEVLGEVPGASPLRVAMVRADGANLEGAPNADATKGDSPVEPAMAGESEPDGGGVDRADSGSTSARADDRRTDGPRRGAP